MDVSTTEWFLNNKNITTLISISVCVISIVLMIYHSWKYMKHRHHVVLKKRFANITLFVAIIQVMKQVSWMILLINNLMWSNNLVYIIIRTPITYSCYFTSIYAVVWRFWMSNFHIHLTKKSLQIKWQSIINKNIKQNWYIKHKNNLGNQVFVFCILTPLVFITVATFSYLSIPNSMNLEMSIINIAMGILLPLCPLIMLFILFTKIPQIDDNFFIYEELKWLLFTFTLSNIAWFSSQPLWSWYQSSKSYYPSMEINTKNYTLTVIYEMATGMIQVVGVLISTWWVNKKITPIIRSRRYQLQQRDSIEYLTVQPSKYSVNSNKANKDIHNDFTKLIDATHDSMEFTVTHEVQQKERLYNDMLKSQSIFDEFVLYLSKDLCISNVLFFIECIQFQQYINEYIIKHPQRVDTHHKLKIPLYRNCRFPDSTALSLIVFGDQGDDGHGQKDIPLNVFLVKCKKKARALYEKYIMLGAAPYKIDITDDTRKALERWIQSEDNWMNDDDVELEDVLDLFEDCIDEAFAILCDSYKRFVMSDKYERLQDIQL